MNRIIVSTVFALGLLACGSDPQADGEKMCEIRQAHQAALAAGNRDEVARIETEGEKFDQDMQAKYKDDPEGYKTMRQAYRNCKNSH